MKYSVGIDIGGTFTDVVLMDERGTIVAEHKVDTTPAALENCFVSALGRATDKLKPADVHRILHATTVA
ncbi:MAG TPA: ROK family protein, partial [Burkholderiales bacterium]|nr:ROK family protein [Burkholderiales bacterium]